MPRSLDPYSLPLIPITPSEASSLVRLRESRMQEGDEKKVLDAFFKICNPFPNTHTSEPLDTAFLNGRKEVFVMFNTVCDSHIKTKRSDEDS